MIAAARNFAAVEGIHTGDEWLSYLPMAWVGDTAVQPRADAGHRHDHELPREP